jgi:hypothetical protein
MKPHVHADLIHAWCEGAEIECFNPRNCEWSVAGTPAWDYNVEYRIKDPYAELKAAAKDPTKQISCDPNIWQDSGANWNWNMPVDCYQIRDKPKPKKQVKLLAWFDGTKLFLRTEDCNYLLSCRRVPSEDKVIEVEE